MGRDFYGAKGVAQRSINKLLDLPATGREQDWEFELADRAKLPQMIEALASASLNFDELCALSLLVLATLQEDGVSMDAEDIRKMATAFRKHSDVRDAMLFYWVELKRADKPDLVQSVLSA